MTCIIDTRVPCCNNYSLTLHLQSVIASYGDAEQYTVTVFCCAIVPLSAVSVFNFIIIIANNVFLNRTLNSIISTNTIYTVHRELFFIYFPFFFVVANKWTETYQLVTRRSRGLAPAVVLDTAWTIPPEVWRVRTNVHDRLVLRDAVKRVYWLFTTANPNFSVPARVNAHFINHSYGVKLELHTGKGDRGRYYANI